LFCCTVTCSSRTFTIMVTITFLPAPKPYLEACACTYVACYIAPSASMMVAPFYMRILYVHDAVHAGLINNAGVQTIPDATTPDGLEVTLGVNFYGPRGPCTSPSCWSLPCSKQHVGRTHPHALCGTHHLRRHWGRRFGTTSSESCVRCMRLLIRPGRGPVQVLLGASH
jgi:hypothetical protein